MNFFDLFSIVSKKDMGISGVTDEFFCVYLAGLLKKEERPILVVVNSLYEANQLYSSLSNYTDSVLLFPMDDFLTSEALAISPDLKINRLETIDSIIESNKRIVITNLMGYLRFLPNKDVYLNHCLSLKVNNDIDPNELVSKLVGSGYTRTTIVNKTGEFAVRGFVVDVFPIGMESPVRFEFFGDTIDSIRLFDFDTQKSFEEIKSVIIKPFSEFITDSEVDEEEFGKQKFLPKYESVTSILSYFDNPITIFKDYSQL